MMGYGFLFMLLLIAIPLFGFVALIFFFANWNRSGDPFKFLNSMNNTPRSGGSYTHKCSNCSMDLDDTWNHCPRCGKVIN